MTEFEQQVADALTEIVSKRTYRDGSSTELRRVWRAEDLAPRVAAAIEAAVAKERDSRQPNQYMLAQDYREAAVWALRGGV